MPIIPIILLCFALVCFVLSSFWTPNPPRLNLIAAGLAFWVAAELIFHIGGAH